MAHISPIVFSSNFCLYLVRIDPLIYHVINAVQDVKLHSIFWFSLTVVRIQAPIYQKGSSDKYACDSVLDSV